MRIPIILLALGVLVPAQAQARDCVWRQQQGLCRDSWTGARYYCTRNVCVYPQTYYYNRERRYHDREERRDRHDRYENQRRDRVYGYRSDDDRDLDQSQALRRWKKERCKWDRRVYVTGSVRLAEDRAKVSAQDTWGRTVEARLGSMYSDIRHAEDQEMTCVQTVPNSNTESAQAAAGVYHHLCELSAIPCPPMIQDQDGETRAKRGLEKLKERLRGSSESSTRP